MKKLILDAPFKDSFSKYLEKGEKIIWQDSAKNKKYSILPVIHEPEDPFSIESVLTTIFLLVTMISGFYFLEELREEYFFLLGIPIYLFIILTHRLWARPIKYAITTNRILFKSTIKRKKRFYEIPFSEINNCLIVENKNRNGTIFLVVKNPEAIPFSTYENGDKRHQPTLENIELPHEVAKLIRQGIRNNL